jgi:DNA polymerase-3 subunit epsilon
MRTPNHRLRTLARAAGLQTVDAHAALGDVRTVAALLPAMLLGLGEEPRFTCGFRPMPVLPRGVRPRPRAQELRKGTGGWMASLLSRLPMSAAEVTDVDAQRYLDALAGALEDGRVLGGEAATLARLAGSAGLGGAQVAELHRRFLESLRSLALADDILTTAEIRQLKTAAGLVGMPTFFDDLRATSPQDLLGNRFVPAPRDAIAG